MNKYVKWKKKFCPVPIALSEKCRRIVQELITVIDSHRDWDDSTYCLSWAYSVLRGLPTNQMQRCAKMLKRASVENNLEAEKRYAMIKFYERCLSGEKMLNKEYENFISRN